MGLRTKIVAALIAASLAAYSQKLDLSSLDALESRAKKSEHVTLDADKLKLAGDFLSQDLEDREAKQVLSRVTGVFVRSFEFDAPLSLGVPELQPIYKQLTAPGWSKIVDVKEKDKEHSEETQIHLFSKGGTMGGLAVISLEGKELTVVNVAGAIGLDELRKLRGSMGIRGIDGLPKPPRPPKLPAPAKKDE